MPNHIQLNITKFRAKIFPGRGGQARAAREMGVSPQEWNRYEKGKHDLNHDTLQGIARTLGVTVAELRKEEKPENSVAEKSGYTIVNNNPLFTAGSRVEFRIPTFGGVAAATEGQDSFYNDGGYDELAIPAGVAVLEVKGRSMEPLARDGQKVFLRPYDSVPQKSDLVVVWTIHHGAQRCLFKRWGGWIRRVDKRDSHDDELILVSVNPIDAVNLVEHVRRDEIAGYRVVAGVWYD